MADQNLWAAWIGVLCGMLSGAVQGLGIHGQTFLGGYGSWPRRLTRLGHISFFGLAAINFAFALTCDRLIGSSGLSGSCGEAAELIGHASWLLIGGAIAMPAVCYLAAWYKPLRHLFFVPVSLLVAGVSILLYEGLVR
jgi:hypothetical protein